MEDTSNEVNGQIPLISNILCYVSTARDSMRSDDMIRTCLAFYKEDEIIKGKDLLFDLGGEKPKRRRGDDRMLHELTDIIDLLKKCDDQGVSLPKFVCNSYNGLPPSSGFEVIGHHILSLIEEISSLKHEAESLKESRFTNEIQQQSNTMMHEDILMIKGEIRKLNHTLLDQNIRRNSLLLSSAENASIMITDTPDCGKHDEKSVVSLDATNSRMNISCKSRKIPIQE